MNLLTQIKYGIRQMRQHGITPLIKRGVCVLREKFLESDYDARHGTDTNGRIPLFHLTIDSANKEQAFPYQASPYDACHQAISNLPVACEDYTFIDLGCGKGRSLLIAAEFAFRRIIGVEFARELVETARQNTRDCPRIEVVLNDAACYDFPAGPLVIYMYNPFQAGLMAQVMQRLTAAARAGTIYLIYIQPHCEEVVLRYAAPLTPPGFIRLFRMPPP